MRIAIVAGVLALAPVSARANPALGETITFERKLVPATGVMAFAQSRTFYLNRRGVMLSPGKDDARTNRSSIVDAPSSVPAWNTSDANWAATVTCIKSMFSRWDVTITDHDPGDVPHLEAVFGGSPQHVGMPPGVGGVSPFAYDCGVIENSIVFTFTNVVGNNPQVNCEVMSQEIAHSYGLDHEMLASDPMTYLSYDGKRAFKDQTVACGEYQNRPCGLGGQVCRPNQNSVQLLDQRLGTGETTGPMVGITAPMDGATVARGFKITAAITGNVTVHKATLYIDDVLLSTVAGPGPYAWPTDAGLAIGPHEIRVDATDGRSTLSESIGVTIRIAGGTGDGGSPTSVGCASGRAVGLTLGLLLALSITMAPWVRSSSSASG